MKWLYESYEFLHINLYSTSKVLGSNELSIVPSQALELNFL